jgi:hypothetical protein
MPSLETVDKDHNDLGHMDTDRATNMGWNGAGGGRSDSYGCGCGWCSGSSCARISSGWGSGGAVSSSWEGGGLSSSWGRRGDGLGWGKDSSGCWAAATMAKDIL